MIDSLYDRAGDTTLYYRILRNQALSQVSIFTIKLPILAPVFVAIG
jgi:hypothetical protein